MTALLTLNDLKDFILSKCEPHERQEVEAFFKSKFNKKIIKTYIEVVDEAATDQETTADEYEDEETQIRLLQNVSSLNKLSEFLKDLL